MKANSSKNIFLLDLVIFVISYLLPVDIFQGYTSQDQLDPHPCLSAQLLDNRFNIWTKGKGQVVCSFKHSVNLITSCRSSNINNATRTRK